MTKALPGIAVAALMGGCASFGLPPEAYNPGGPTGYGRQMFGHLDRCEGTLQFAAPPVCEIRYVSDAFGGLDMAHQFAVRRAAEVGQAIGFPYMSLAVPQFREYVEHGTKAIEVKIATRYFLVLPAYADRPSGTGAILKVEPTLAGKRSDPAGPVQQAWFVAIDEFPKGRGQE